MSKQAEELSAYLRDRWGGEIVTNTPDFNISGFDSLLWKYKKEELKEVIDFLYDVKKQKFFSVRFFEAQLPQLLEEIARVKTSKLIKQQIEEEMLEYSKLKRQEEVDYGESTTRNSDKARRFGLQPRFRAKHSLDLFER